MSTTEKLHIPARSLYIFIITVLLGCKGFIQINVDMEKLYPHIAAFIDYCFFAIAVLTAIFWAYKEIMWKVQEFLDKQQDDSEMIRFIDTYRRVYIRQMCIVAGRGGNPAYFFTNDNYLDAEKADALRFFQNEKNKRLTEAAEIVNRYYQYNRFNEPDTTKK